MAVSEETGYDPLCEIEDGRIQLHDASRNGRLEVVKFFITEKHCDPMCRGQFGRTPLHCACQNGHLDVVKYLTDKQQADPSCQDEKDSSTPLHLASINGHLAVVRFLIEEKGCDPLCRDKYGNTPLHYASRNGRLEVVKFFITEKHCDPMCRGQFGRTPLHCACQSGHLDVVKYLIDEQQADPSCQDEKDSSTPLHLASINGHMAVVRFLSEEKGCDPLCRDKYDDIPLHDACLNGRLEVIKFFITEKHFDPMCRGQFGRTPLHCACQNGHLDVVKYLIDEQQADPSCQDEKDSSTPLHLASINGHMAVVRFLSEEKGCDPLCRDKYDDTPLHVASLNGRLEMIKFFITEKHCDPMCRGQFGRTPLHCACLNGHLDVVKYLIDEQQADPSCQDAIGGSTPLHLALINGHMAVVRFLSEEKGCDPLCRNGYVIDKTPLHRTFLNGMRNMAKFFITEKHLYCDPMYRGQWGRTPLHHACLNGHLDVVKYLIDEQQADPSCQDEKDGSTPLHLASINGHMAVVKFLSEEKGCDPLCRDKYGNTPLHYASLNGRLEVVKFFITEKHCDPMCRGELGRTPLHHACLNGHLDVVKYLIDELQTDSSCRDESNLTPLHLSSMYGHIDIVKYLNEHKGCDPLCRDKNGSTPLHKASLHGRLEVLKYFITDKQCNPMCRGQRHSTPLHYACQNGHLDVVKYLIDEAQADPSCRDAIGITPLHLACKEGHLGIVRFLIDEKKIDPAVMDADGNTPLDIANKSRNTEIVLYLLSKGGGTKYGNYLNTHSLKSWSPLYPIVEIFLVGNSGSGKSTLVKALQFENSKWTGRFINVRGITPETAGIIPNEFTSNRFGKVILYDLAGHEEYHASHELVFESASHTIVLIIVDLRKSMDEIRRELSYWQLLVTNAVTSAGCHVHVIAVGSHTDKLGTQELEAKTAFLSEVMQSPSQEALHHKGWVTLDCRKSSSRGISSLRQFLVQSCKSVRIEVDFDYINASYLNAFISEYMKDTVACTFGDLFTQIHQSQSEVLTSQSKSVLYHACESLNTSGHLLFLKNEENTEESWAIFNKEAILSRVHGLLKNLKLSNRAGVLALSQLENALKKQGKSLISIDLAIRYMLKMMLCFEIDLEALKQIEGFEATTFPSEDRYFFFPDLISEQHPIPNSIWNFDTDCYLTGWCLTCTEPSHFFTPRFLQLLLISLARQFALVPQPQDSRTLLELSPGCKLWKNGIRWLDADGIESIVEVTEQSTNVVMMMRCLKGNEMAFIKYRSSVIQKILQIRKKVCIEVNPKEFFIHPHCLKTYPMLMISRIPMSQIARPILYKNPFVPLDDEALLHTPGYPFLSLEELLFFEPYHHLGMELVRDIFNSQCSGESTVPDNIIQEMAICMEEKWQHLAHILQVSVPQVENDPNCLNNFQKCRRTLVLWAVSSSSGTYHSLRHSLSHYSIFAGRNPLKLYPELTVALPSGAPDSPANIARSADHDGGSESGDKDPELAIDASKSPSMVRLLSFSVAQGPAINIPQQISTKYRTFGIHLLNDHTGAIVDGIAHRRLNDSTEINTDILQKWISGEGRRPVSWGTLTACLRDSGLSELADDIKQTVTHF